MSSGGKIQREKLRRKRKDFCFWHFLFDGKSRCLMGGPFSFKCENDSVCQAICRSFPWPEQSCVRVFSIGRQDSHQLNQLSRQQTTHRLMCRVTTQNDGLMVPNFKGQSQFRNKSTLVKVVRQMSLCYAAPDPRRPFYYFGG